MQVTPKTQNTNYYITMITVKQDVVIVHGYQLSRNVITVLMLHQFSQNEVTAVISNNYFEHK